LVDHGLALGGEALDGLDLHGRVLGGGRTRR
jgi:hypothetical protein